MKLFEVFVFHIIAVVGDGPVMGPDAMICGWSVAIGLDSVRFSPDVSNPQSPLAFTSLISTVDYLCTPMFKDR